MWTCAGVLLAVAAGSLAITRDQFYPFGPNLDQQLPKGPEASSPETPLKTPIVFYGDTYDSIFVNNHGILSFRADIPSFMNSEFPLPYPSLAVFYTNVDTTMSGDVFYREASDAHTINKAAESIKYNFHEYEDFQPASVFIATWIDVTYGNSIDILKNSFQIAVISNGTESFVELLYPDGGIRWIQTETQPGSLPDAKAQAGFIAEDGRMYTLLGSGTQQIRNIWTRTNVHEPGKYVFRIGDISPEVIGLPDDYNQDEVEIEEETKTCAQSGPSVCDLNARCVDYQAGICCVCNDGFYGNGKSCIKTNVPLRAHGKLTGSLNNVPLTDVDIQAYIVVEGGRAYTALSQTPPNLGASFLLLSDLGGVMGWLFAIPSSDAKNGYQLTGAIFNHTAEITFPATNDYVIINQEYIGHDVFDQLILDSEIKGTVPLVNSDVKLELLEYEEQYTTVKTGTIRSQSNRTFVDKKSGKKYNQIVTQTIDYLPCRNAPSSEEDNVPLTLRTGKIFLGYEATKDIVRYGMSDKITPLGEDPCVQGRQTCGPDSTCVVQGNSFTCICRQGFTNAYSEYRSSCEDIDECATGTHTCDPNADCYNEEGSYRCECRQGTSGNGFTCAVLSQCEHLSCSSNAECIQSSPGQAVCVCNAGFTGDGKECWNINDDRNPCSDCSPDADCFRNDENEFVCICKPNFLGNGYSCEFNYEYETSTPYIELLQDTRRPICNENECNCPLRYVISNINGKAICIPQQEEDTNAGQAENNSSSVTCYTESDCPPNAICVYSAEIGANVCSCPEGFEGDGKECIERTDTECECGPNARCEWISSTEQVCTCKPGFHGNGYTCEPSYECKNDSDCEYNAECRPDPTSSQYVCQCISGYVKDQNDACIPAGTLCSGAICAEHASCLYDSELRVKYCNCDHGYVGEGVRQCIPQDQTCDVANDCSPNAICTNTEYSYECMCNEGYVGDGYTCNPEPNCRNIPYLCDSHASCLNRVDNFVCECNIGYYGNGSHCDAIPKLPGGFLITSDGMFVYKVPFEQSPHNIATPISSIIDQLAVAIAVDCHGGRIYWSDIVSNTIKRSAYDGTNFEIVFTNDIKAPEGMSIDWTSRNMYWTDAKKHTIEVANVDTKIRKVLFDDGSIANPRGIVVHPRRNKIFWSDWNRKSPKIEWANMDGSQREIFVAPPDVKLPNSLAIDWSQDRLCYADAGLKTIECVNIETRVRETIATNCQYPFGLAVSQTKFYWTDWKSFKIEFVDIQTGEKGHLPIKTSSRKMFGLAIAPDQCEDSYSVCQYRNGNCAANELCLPDGRGGRTCVPEGY